MLSGIWASGTRRATGRPRCRSVVSQFEISYGQESSKNPTIVYVPANTAAAKASLASSRINPATPAKPSDVMLEFTPDKCCRLPAKDLQIVNINRMSEWDTPAVSKTAPRSSEPAAN